MWTASHKPWLVSLSKWSGLGEQWGSYARPFPSQFNTVGDSRALTRGNSHATMTSRLPVLDLLLACRSSSSDGECSMATVHCLVLSASMTAVLVS